MGRVLSTALSLRSLYKVAGGFTTRFGFGLGLMAAEYFLSPRQVIEGPRLTDREVQVADYGWRIPWIFGTVRTAGAIIWTKGIREEENRGSGGGKGPRPPVEIEYSYYWTGAIKVCGNKIKRIRTIWYNDKVIYKTDGTTQTGYEMTFDAATDTWSSDTIRYTLGTDKHQPDSLLETDFGVGKAPAHLGDVVVYFEDFPLDGPLGTFTFEVEGDLDKLDGVCSFILEQNDYLSSYYDVSALSEITVEGLIVDDRSSGKDVLDMLAKMYHFDWSHRDGKDVAVLRGSDSVVTIPSSSMRVHPLEEGYHDDTSMPNTVMRKGDPIDLPNWTEIQFSSKDRQYAPDIRASWWEAPGYVGGDNKAAFSVPMVLSPEAAQRNTDIALPEAFLDSHSFSLLLNSEYRYLSTADPVTIEFGGQQVRVRLLDCVSKFYGTLEWKAVRDDKELYSAPAGSPGEVLPEPPVESFPDFAFVMADSNTLRLQDASNGGYYAGVTVPFGIKYSGVYMECLDAGVLLDPGNKKGKSPASIYFPLAATIGNVVGTLPDHAGGSTDWDTSTTLRVELIGGRALSSSTDSKVLNQGANAALVGSESGGWEVIQFVNATFVGHGTDGVSQIWDLTRLKRGRRGSESQIPTHASGEKFLLLDDAVQRVEVNPSAIGIEHDYRFSYVSRDTNSTTHSFTVSGNNLKPAAVANLQGAKNADDQWAFSWDNVSRLADLPTGTIGAPVDPIAPDLNQYEVDVIDQSDDSVVATYKVSLGNRTFAYRRTDQMADFGSLQSSLKIRVYRMSAIVGRGYPAEVTEP